jgi:hypothetical protein
MSTQAIRNLITAMRGAVAKHHVPDGLLTTTLDEALVEVEAIEKAAAKCWARDDVMERLEDAGAWDVIARIARQRSGGTTGGTNQASDVTAGASGEHE